MKPRTFWPQGIFAAFAFFFAGLATLVTIATTHTENLVSDNYYEREINFQSELDNAARARSAGAAIRYEATGREVVVTMPQAQLARQFSGTAEFYRPDAPARDHTLTLAPRSDGTQIVDVSRYAVGPWLLRVSWQAGGQGYYLEQKFTVSAN